MAKFSVLEKSDTLNAIGMLEEALNTLRHCNVRSQPMKVTTHEDICRQFEKGLISLKVVLHS